MSVVRKSCLLLHINSFSPLDELSIALQSRNFSTVHLYTFILTARRILVCTSYVAYVDLHVIKNDCASILLTNVSFVH